MPICAFRSTPVGVVPGSGMISQNRPVSAASVVVPVMVNLSPASLSLMGSNESNFAEDACVSAGCVVAGSAVVFAAVPAAACPPCGLFVDADWLCLADAESVQPAISMVATATIRMRLATLIPVFC